MIAQLICQPRLDDRSGGDGASGNLMSADEITKQVNILSKNSESLDWLIPRACAARCGECVVAFRKNSCFYAAVSYVYCYLHGSCGLGIWMM